VREPERGLSRFRFSFTASVRSFDFQQAVRHARAACFFTGVATKTKCRSELARDLAREPEKSRASSILRREKSR
jgi:hypothetical protein